MDGIPISKDKLFQELDYTPHEKQWLFHESSARFRIPTCGRRWGKSLAAGNELTWWCFRPESYFWIVGPNYGLAEKEFRVVFMNFVRKLKLPKIKTTYNPKQGHMTIRFPWDTVIEVKSAEKQDSLVGEGLDGLVLSEAALHKRSTYDQFLEPALSDRRGHAIFPSTPRGHNWYKGLWLLGQDRDMPGYESWRFPTWTNTVRYPGGRNDPEIRRIEGLVSPQYFMQEYGAEFTTYEGQIYEEFQREIHVKDFDYRPEWRNYWAIDWGFSAPFVCLDIMVDPSDNVYVWREYQVRFKTVYEHAQALTQFRTNPRGFHIDGVFADPRGAEDIATFAMTAGMNVIGRPVAWNIGVEYVKRWLKLQADGSPKLFIHPSCSELIRQMESLRIPDEKEGKNPREGQHDFDDHGPDALRYFFGEFFVLGAGASLADVYGTRVPTEAESFFVQKTHFTKTGAGSWR